MAQIGGRRFDHFHIPQVQLGEDFDHGGYSNHFIGEDLEEFLVLDLVHHLFSTMGCPKFDNSNASNVLILLGETLGESKSVCERRFKKRDDVGPLQSMKPY